MNFLSKIFCCSPNCKNDCGNKMSKEEEKQLKILQKKNKKDRPKVYYDYFCEKPGDFCGDCKLAQEFGYNNCTLHAPEYRMNIEFPWKIE